MKKPALFQGQAQVVRANYSGGLHRLPWPPYGRRAAERLDPSMKSSTPNFGELVIHTGPRAWDLCCDDARAAVLLPPEQPPEAFDWAIAKLTSEPFKTALLIDSGARHEILDRLATCLVQAGVRQATILPLNSPLVVYKSQEVDHAA